MGDNYFAKLIYFIVLIVLAILLIPTFSYYKLGWLIIYLLLGIVCFSGAFALSLFFILNIIIGLVFYIKTGNIIYLELLLVLILGFVASVSNIKKNACATCQTKAPIKFTKSEQIKKELGPDAGTPKVEVYGKTEKKATKTTKKKKVKKTKKKAKKKTTKRKAAKKKTKKKATKKKTKKRTKKKAKKKRR